MRMQLPIRYAAFLVSVLLVLAPWYLFLASEKVGVLGASYVGADSGGIIQWTEHQQGWPLTFAEFEIGDGTVNYLSWSTRSFLWDIVAAVLLSGSAIFVLILIRRSRFHLWHMFLVVALLAAILGMLVTSPRDSATSSDLSALKSLHIDADLSYAGPLWLARLVGRRQLPDRFFTVDAIVLNDAQIDPQAASATIEKLSSLKIVRLSGPQFNDVHVRWLSSLTISKRLRSLALDETGITDEALRNIDLFPEIEHLSLEYTDITSRGIDSLRGNASLRDLKLEGSLVSERVIPAFESMPRLDSASFRDTPAEAALGTGHWQREYATP
jgi:hypothetical protein